MLLSCCDKSLPVCSLHRAVTTRVPITPLDEVRAFTSRVQQALHHHRRRRRSSSSNRATTQSIAAAHTSWWPLRRASVLPSARVGRFPPRQRAVRSPRTLPCTPSRAVCPSPPQQQRLCRQCRLRPHYSTRMQTRATSRPRRSAFRCRQWITARYPRPRWFLRLPIATFLGRHKRQHQLPGQPRPQTPRRRLRCPASSWQQRGI